MRSDLYNSSTWTHSIYRVIEAVFNFIFDYMGKLQSQA